MSFEGLALMEFPNLETLIMEALLTGYMNMALI